MSTRKEGGRAAREPGREASAFTRANTRELGAELCCGGRARDTSSHRALKPSRLTSLRVLLTAPPSPGRNASSPGPPLAPLISLSGSHCLRPGGGESSPCREEAQSRSHRQRPAATHTGWAFPHPPKGTEETSSRPRRTEPGDSAHTPRPGRCRQ